MTKNEIEAILAQCLIVEDVDEETIAIQGIPEAARKIAELFVICQDDARNTIAILKKTHQMQMSKIEKALTETGLPEKGSEDDQYFLERKKWIEEHGAATVEEVVCLAFADLLAMKCGFEVKR